MDVINLMAAARFSALVFEVAAQRAIFGIYPICSCGFFIASLSPYTLR